MGFQDPGLLTRIRETFPGSFHRCGKRSFYRRFGSTAPSVRIEDAPVRVHKLSSRALRDAWMYRRERLAELGANVSALEAAGVPLESRVPLWVDVFVLFMGPVNKFFAAHDDAETYVMSFDRGTPPAKCLIHIERYKGKTKKLEDRHRITGPDHLEKIFSYHEVPEFFDYYMRQKGFVDKLSRVLAHTFIVDHYRPPAGKMFILDGPGKANPYVFRAEGRTMLDDDVYRNGCLEADLSLIFWCGIFRNHNIEVSTVDGDLVFGLLLQARARITASRPSGTADKSMDFQFSNIIVLEKASSTYPENQEQRVSPEYAEESQRPMENELNSESRGKIRYLERLGDRYRRQAQEDREFDSDDGFTLDGDRSPAKARALASPAAQPSAMFQALMSAPTAGGPDDVPGSKRKRGPAGAGEIECNERLQTRCDVVYTPEGEKKFVDYEFININHLFQSIYDYSLSGYEDGLETTDLSAFLPVEQFCAMGMLCGNDYVKKPDRIGAKFIFNAYFKYLNEFGTMVYGERVNGDRCSYVGVLDYEEPLHLVIDYEAMVRLIQAAFNMKGTKAPFTVTERLRVSCANTRFSVNYFANDFKARGTGALDCFDVHVGCGLSMYGYSLPDPTKPPSQENIERPAQICHCFLQDIRAYVARQAEGKVRWT